MADLNSKEWQQKSLHDSNAIIIDVRTKDEVAEGMIPHAINIDVKEPSLFLEQVNKLDKSKNFYMYCQSGARSAQACAVLNLMCDIPNTYNLVGGFSAWNKDFPI
jgi:rhodanese-related sulfurtransferase